MIRDKKHTVDDVFTILSNRRRRYALYYVDHAKGTTISDLAEQIAAWEYDLDISEVTSTQRKRVYNSLQQTHLPKLDDAGYVDYDSRKGTVEPTPQVDTLNAYLEFVQGRKFSWSRYYLGLAIVGMVLLLAEYLGVLGIISIPTLAWVSGFVVAFTGVAAVHKYTQYRAKPGRQPVPPEIRERVETGETTSR